MATDKTAVSDLNVLRMYLREVGKHPIASILVVIGTIGTQVASLISPLYMRDLFNTLASGTPSADTNHHLVIVIALIGLASFVAWAFLRLQIFATIDLETAVMPDLYLTAFQYLLGHSYFFFTSHFAGTLTRRVSKFSDAFETIFDVFFQTFLPSAVFVIGAVGILFLSNHLLGFVLAVWVVLFIWFQIYVSKLRQPLRVKRSADDSAMVGALSDAISNQNTVVMFAGIAYEYALFKGFVERWQDSTVRSWNAEEYMWGSQAFFMVGINVVLLFGALAFWERGQLTIGDFVLIQTYLIGTFNVCGSVGQQLRRFYDAFANATEMVEILDLEHEIHDIPDAPALVVPKGGVDFKDVGFFFNPERPILTGFNLSVQGGEKIALVGHSGAGKSTITRLLLRFYDVKSGTIEIDGQNIAQVTQESLRNAIAFVPQEPILFHRSLLENIRYGRRDASDEEVIEAAKKAHCHEFIAQLPEGYNTFVGERGVKLSGGERQRVAIARAILKNAPILVLDEATSSLDSESESFIQDSLRTLMQGRTTLVIAHRLSTIRNMDRILVIEEGKIAAQGTHTELLKEDGLYQKLWSIQAGGFLKDEE